MPVPAGSNPAIPTPGSEARDGPGDPDDASPNPAISTLGSARRSLCEPFREIIEAKLTQGLTAQWHRVANHSVHWPRVSRLPCAEGGPPRRRGGPL